MSDKYGWADAMMQVLDHPEGEHAHQLRLMREVGDRVHMFNFDTLEWDDMADTRTVFAIEPCHRLVRSTGPA